MTKDDLAHLTDEALLEIYEAAARAHGEGTEKGDYRSTNRAHDRLAAAYRTLRSRGDASQRGILRFLSSENLAVRCWAAAHALEFAPEEGEPVLRELAESEPGLIRLNAEMTLSVWRDGELRFP